MPAGMRFLFDQSADFRLIPRLHQLGHDVSAISREHPHGLTDEDVLATARNKTRILLVADREAARRRIIFLSETVDGLAHEKNSMAVGRSATRKCGCADVPIEDPKK